MKPISATNSHLSSSILQHVQGFWPNSTLVEEQWKKGPIQQDIPGFRVLKIKSKTSGLPIVYVTNGCFIVEPMQDIKHEFFLLAPTEEKQHVETLTMLADFHADERYRLDIGSVVNIGAPWMPGSECDHLLISTPYPYGPKLEWLKLEKNCIRFLWVLPITAREAAFMELNGQEALEQKFDAVRVDYLNPIRASVV